MKKLILSILTVFVLGISAKGQDKISIVPKAGYTYSSLSLKEKENIKTGYNSGFLVGAGLNIPASAILSIQPEILYTQKGLKYVSLSGNPYFYKRTLNYLEVPLLCKATFGYKTLKYYFTAGPSLGLALNGRETRVDAENGIDKYIVRFNEEKSDADTKFYHPKYYNAVDFGLQLGGGTQIALGTGSLQIEARFGLGLTDFHKRISEGANQIKGDGKTRVFSLTVGYALPLGI